MDQASRSRCSSPEPNCAICLGDLENMSYTDSCFHKFCFTCLVEWSKVRRVNSDVIG
jgi:E3 ubiquitin-protein ligase Topors